MGKVLIINKNLERLIFGVDKINFFDYLKQKRCLLPGNKKFSGFPGTTKFFGYPGTTKIFGYPGTVLFSAIRE